MTKGKSEVIEEAVREIRFDEAQPYTITGKDALIRKHLTTLLAKGKAEERARIAGKVRKHRDRNRILAEKAEKNSKRWNKLQGKANGLTKALDILAIIKGGE